MDHLPTPLDSSLAPLSHTSSLPCSGTATSQESKSPDLDIYNPIYFLNLQYQALLAFLTPKSQLRQ